jgi:hypothetical protein
LDRTPLYHPFEFAWWQRIDGINAIIKAIAATDSMLSYLDCGGMFLAGGGRIVNQSLFMDVIHPNPAGICRARIEPFFFFTT